jgi:serine/threonine protein kinase
MPVAPGTRLGPHEVLARIGEGGMGVVYRALDRRLDRQVAIKLLPADSAADQQARERLHNEAMAAAALDHPYICKIFEIGEYGESLFLVMRKRNRGFLSLRFGGTNSRCCGAFGTEHYDEWPVRIPLRRIADAR